MSIIMDGMDQNHCRVPYLGSQSKFGSPLDQGITGIKEHGVGFFIYRTVGNVKNKSADFSIYCILSQLELWLQRHKCFPEELFIQLDGGAENANMKLLAMLEFIVTKRLVRVIQFTRLPVGHTHEDIDACFAQIWSSSRGSSCLTLDEYKKNITDHLKNSKIPTTVKDVYVIPAYGKLLDGCVDTKLSKLHKWPYTQHCWRFEAVVASDHTFKFGCKTTYKAYCSDKVVELLNKTKSQCYSVVGQYTGLEPMTVYCPWYPKENGLEGKYKFALVKISISVFLVVANIDYNSFITIHSTLSGTYLLRKLPIIFRSSQEMEAIEPHDFDMDGVRNIKTCLSEVKRKFVGVNENELSWWIKWENDHVRVLTSAVEYVKYLKDNGQIYHTPLAGYLFGQDKPVVSVWRSKLSLATSDINPEFQWPEVLAAATQSVQTEFNPHPPEPRVVIIDQNMIREVLMLVYGKINSYYTSVTTSLRVASIKEILNQKVQPSGITIKSSNGNKQSLVEIWKQNDNAFLIAVFSELSPIQLRSVEPLCLPNQPNMNNVKTSLKNNIIYTKNTLNQINGHLPFHKSGMNAMLNLFRKRNEIVVRINNSYKSSIFVDVETCEAIMNHNLLSEFSGIISTDSQLMALNQVQLENLSRMYFPYLQSDGIWGMIIIDFRVEALYYVYLGIRSDDAELDELLKKVSIQFNTFLNELFSNELNRDEVTEWETTIYPLNESSCPEEFTGVFILLVLYFIVQECPVYIPIDQLKNIRRKFSYWLIDGALPM
jgi:hypothetical protein